ncbi:MAG TPA: membrane protein insertase YidC, partial [Phaeodactylibacter sp.]|nr:membrane protein insertase YidC [Phaeodactylibacter sp.]
PEKADYLKKCETRLDIPFKGKQDFSMNWYIGPNDFDILQAHQRDLEYTVAYGSSILGTINRWIIRPIFNFLSSFVGSMGLAIFLLTLIVKLTLYPLAYKMLYQQSKMAALKPVIEKVKERFKDDPQQQQVETMKLYQEYGVNPLGGCLPTLLQMPIWIALYRFFPAAIEFRQKGFLWATDLSSYDVAFALPFNIPAYGDHVSLFTLLWVITTIVYTYYNSKHMDMSANPAMKYVQYFMPVMFLFFFNNYAAGLTVYLLFSNILNIAQTVITKNYIVDQEKIKRELEAAKAKPKKKGGFRERLQKALEEQQRIAEQQKKKKKR